MADKTVTNQCFIKKKRRKNLELDKKDDIVLKGG